MSHDASGRRWLVTGAEGMLGRDIVRVLRSAGTSVTGASRSELDIRDPRACAAATAGHDVVVNCAAWTAVDDAETHEAHAFAINSVGASHLAKACRSVGARLVQMSTDYVFDGSADTPYAEDAPLAPRSAYGRTKAAGEWSARAEHEDVLVVRTAWLYGRHGRCFPRSVALALAARGSIDVVTDQVGQPTWTIDVARVLIDLVRVEAAAGSYHATASGETSWHGFATAVARARGVATTAVLTTTSDRFVRPASRPAYSVLSHQTLRQVGVQPIGNWSERFALAAPQVLSDLC